MTDATGAVPAAPDEEGDPDVEAVRRTLAGDRRAFDQIVLRNQRRAFNIAYRILGDHDEARDLTQDAFIRAYRSLGQFRAEARFSQWFTAILVNLCRNRLKHWKRRARSRTASLSDPVGPDGSELRRDVPEPGPDALAQLSERQFEELVREEMRNVDAEYREVLVLRELQEVPYEEIAAALGIPVGTVKSRLHRGRAALRELLGRRLGHAAAGGGAT